MSWGACSLIFAQRRPMSGSSDRPPFKVWEPLGRLSRSRGTTVCFHPRARLADKVFHSLKIIMWNISFFSVTTTLCCMNSVFRRFLRYIPRQAFIVYRLIAAALIRSFSIIPFLFWNRNFGQMFFLDNAIQQWVKQKVLCMIEFFLDFINLFVNYLIQFNIR